MRVLSIDGGGIRGIIPATVLMALEELTGRPVADLFDVLVGTSTGGILALALTCRQPDGRLRPASEVRSLYVDRGAEIFPLGGVPLFGLPPKGSGLWGVRPPLPADASPGEKLKNMLGWQNAAKLGALTGGRGEQGNARYPAGPLTAQLQAQLGTALMSDAVRPVAVVSCDLDNHTPLVFRGGGLDQGDLGNAAMWHAARATSAGPTFFQPLHYKGVDGVTRRCADGGLVANDPALLGYTEGVAIQRAADRPAEDVLLVSLGTGTKEPGRPPELDDVAQLGDTRTWLQLLPGVQSTITSAPGELVREQLASLLGARYVRLQTVVGHGAVHAMDNVLPTNITGLQRTGEQLVRDAAPMLRQLAALL